MAFKPILLVLFFFLLTRLYIGIITPFFVGDEANYVHMYFQFLETGRPDIYGELVVKPAGQYYLTAPLLLIFVPVSDSLGIPIEVPFRLVTIIFGLATLWILYEILLKLSKSETGAAMGTLFFSILPNFFMISSIYYPDVYLIFFSFLSFWVLLCRDDWKGSLLAGFLTGVAFYIKLQQAFLVFALILPYMVLKKKIRVDYFVYSSMFSLIFLLIFVLTYYPARSDSAMLLLKTELFARNGISMGTALLNLVNITYTYFFAFILGIGLVLGARQYFKKQSPFYEYSQIALLVLFSVFVSSFWYSAILYFGLSLLFAKAFDHLLGFEKLIVFGLLILILLQTSSVMTSIIYSTAYDWPSQKQVGLFLVDKYPVTFIMNDTQMRIWNVYDEVYEKTDSPVLLAKMRMAILPYKFLYEKEPQIQNINAYWYYADAELDPIAPSLLESEYVATEKGYEKFLEKSLMNYSLIGSFGEEPGFLVYAKNS